MNNALSVFKANITSVRELASLHEYLCLNVKSPMSFDDLLRFQMVYSVSAFDKLIHDLVRIGMIEIFTGKRLPTPKYLNESLSMDAYNSLVTATVPPKEHIFSQEIIKKHKALSYQSPDKVSDGLSYIWDEKQKWKKIADRMAMDEEKVKTTLKLIVDRRNQIVHEADIDIVSGTKYPIATADCVATVSFVEKCGEEITKLVI